MTATERLKKMVAGEKMDSVGACGWIHTPGVDRRSTEEFSSKIIEMTDYSHWDMIKVMANGGYTQEAFGVDIEYFSDELSEEDMKTKRLFQIHHNLVESPRQMEAFPVLDVSKNVVFQREIANIKALADHYQGTVPIMPTIFCPAHCIPEFVGGFDKARWFFDNHPEAVEKMLKSLLETEFQLMDAYIEAGADGFFFAQRYSNEELLSESEFVRFCRAYDEQLLAHIKDRTWFNMMHVHGARKFYWNHFKDYAVQAINWENTPMQVPKEDRATVAKVRQITDKVLVTGTDQFYDFYGPKEEVLEGFRKRLKQAAEESEDNRLIFAPGCSLPLDVDNETLHLLRVAVDEYNASL